MDVRTMKKRGAVMGASVALLAAVLLSTLILMSDATKNSDRFGQLYALLFVFNILGLATFIVLIGAKIRQLVRQLRGRVPGSRLTLRMLLLFIALSVTPVLVVYAFSMDFINRGIDSWFDVEVEQALIDSVELSRSALDLHMRELLKKSQRMAEEVTDSSKSIEPLNLALLRRPQSTIVSNIGGPPFDLDAFRELAGAEEAMLLTRSGGVIVSSSTATDIVPDPPPEAVLLQVQQGRSYVGLDPSSESGLYIRVVTSMPQSLEKDTRILQAMFPIGGHMDEQAKSVESAHTEYKELAFLREPLKLSFTLTLTLALLFSIFVSVWSAFFWAGRLAAPIRDLAEGTASVAQGDLEITVPVTSNDEMGWLASSFNDMTHKLMIARDEAKFSRDQADAERAYLEAVLQRLSSGVVTLDTDCRLRTVNSAADQILGLNLRDYLGETLSVICRRHRYLAPFGDAVERHLEDASLDWLEQIVFFGSSGRQVLMCRGAILSGHTPGAREHVIVFDDITVIMQGQKDAAWSEVARRLAHEIKNPLTPIQLSAERLRRKYLDKMSPDDAQVLDRLTNTIVQQVETMRNMVNTFSDYARSPQTAPTPLDINTLLSEVSITC
jgi:nitrogen fixation/metabolism regulation signal transduction histidine kinase